MRLYPAVAIRALTFDYGGTLDGEASHWLDRFIDLYREAGVVLPFENIKKLSTTRMTFPTRTPGSRKPTCGS